MAAFFWSMNWSAACIRRSPGKSFASSTIRPPIRKTPKSFSRRTTRTFWARRSAKPALRRDQVWLTEKDGEGATVLYPLTDYKPRKAENLERGYLQGRYGAIPFLSDFALAGE